MDHHRGDVDFQVKVAMTVFRKHIENNETAGRSKRIKEDRKMIEWEAEEDSGYEIVDINYLQVWLLFN